MDNNEGQLEELKMRLKKEKGAKRKLKRQLKLKIAQKRLKWKSKYKNQKKLLKQLKKSTEKESRHVDNGAIHYDIDNIEDKSATMSTGQLNDTGNIEDNSATMSTGQPNDTGGMKNNIGSYVRHFHPYAMPIEYIVAQVYRCSKCGYNTKKKYNLDKHESTSHGVKPVRDIKCPICEKFFDYDGLRNHLNHFITGKFEAKKEHAMFTPMQHKMELEKLKQHKKNSL